MGHSLEHSVWMKCEPVQPRSAQCGSSLFSLCIFQPVEKPRGRPAPPLCCPATLSPLNYHLSLILGTETKIKERLGRRKLATLVILFERSIRSLGNIFLAGESGTWDPKAASPAPALRASCQQQSHLHPRSRPPARRGSLHTLPAWLQSSRRHIHAQTQLSWAGSKALAPRTLQQVHTDSPILCLAWTITTQDGLWGEGFVYSYIKVRAAGSRLKAWNLGRLHVSQGQELSPTSVCGGVACTVTERCLDLAFSGNLSVWEMHKQAHRRFQSGAFCPPHL